jgi:hypothetical protein
MNTYPEGPSESIDRRGPFDAEPYVDVYGTWQSDTEFVVEQILATPD